MNAQSRNPTRHSAPLRRWLRRSIACALFIPALAFAHKLNLFTYVEGGQVYVEGYFADGVKAKNSDVTVLNAAREVIVEGKTDDEGKFRFPVAEPTELRIVLNAGLGHQAEYTLSASEVGGTTPATARAAAAETAAPGPAEGAPAQPTAATAPGVAPEQLSAAIEKAVADAVRPLGREISELKSKTSLADIIGGIGYIIGILGLFAYQKARRAQPRG